MNRESSVWKQRNRGPSSARRVGLSAAVTLLFSLATVAGMAGRGSSRAQGDERHPPGVLPAVLMEDRDIEKLDLYYGSGGKENAPGPDEHYTFLKEDLSQGSPKFDVEDSKGRIWRVKIGNEPQAETAAARLLWAVGYFSDDDYYLEEMQVDKLHHLERGGKFLSPGGVVHKARLERRTPEMKSNDNWKWFENPFLGTKELDGLRVMMALISNWDPLTRNNSIYEVGGQRRYVVSDVGASFGRSGNEFKRSIGNVEDYVRTPFVKSATAQEVDFAIDSRPIPILLFITIHYYRDLVKGQKVYKNIPREHAKWIGQRLARLSETQIRDCFRAAGFTADEIAAYVKAVQGRIADLNAL